MGPTFTERRHQIDVVGWMTDVISIDPTPKYNPHHSDFRPSSVHTILFWIPGNPGQHDWYISDFMDVLSKLGEGYAVRSVSHAGHGLFGKMNGEYADDDAYSITDVEKYCRFGGGNNQTKSVSPLVPWTVDGQVLHKIAYIDQLLSSIEMQNRQRHINTNNTSQCTDECTFESTKDLKFIMIGHSFGCHIIQRMCVLRPDILERVTGHLFLMPYIRTKPSLRIDQRKLEFGGSHSELLFGVGTRFSGIIRSFPESLFRSVIRHGLRDGGESDERIVSITTNLLRNPLYPRNFFELGTEELRDIPNEIDMSALRLLSSYGQSSFHKPQNSESQPQSQQEYRPICILYAGDNDQWCPFFHGEEIRALQLANQLPRSIKTTKMSGLRHDYVCLNNSKRSKVNDWIVSHINQMNNDVRVKMDGSTCGGDSAATGHQKKSMNGGGSDTWNSRAPIPKLRSKL